MTIILGTLDGGGVSWPDVRAKVRGDLWRPGNGVNDDVVDRALHASLLELEGERRWLWLENVFAALTMDATADFIDLPATVISVSSLQYTHQNRRDPVARRPLDAVRALASESQGSPDAYAVTDRRLYFDCRVPASATFELVFSSGTPERLVDAIDAANITLELHQQAIIALASSYVALTFLKNEDEAARQRTGYERHLDRLMNKEDAQRSDTGGGGVQPYDDYFQLAHGRR